MIAAIVPKEYITHEPQDADAWVCACGNTSHSSGFQTCDREGNDLEPTKESNWDNLYRCDACGRIIDRRTLEVVSVKSHPTTPLYSIRASGNKTLEWDVYRSDIWICTVKNYDEAMEIFRILNSHDGLLKSAKKIFEYLYYRFPVRTDENYIELGKLLDILKPIIAKAESKYYA